MVQPCPKISLRQINERGVELIEQGKFSSAIESLANGLQIVRSLLLRTEGSLAATTESSVPLSPENPPTDTDNCITSRQPAEEDHSMAHAMPSKVSSLLQQNTEFIPGEFLYAWPMLVEPSDRHLYSYQHYAFTMMFNMALAYHLSALSNQSYPSDLNNALELYQLAYSLHLQEGLDVPLVQSCAIVNNIGQIQRCLNDGEKATMCFGHLLSILMLIVEASEEDVQPVPESLTGFFHNVSSLILEDPHLAPAA